MTKLSPTGEIVYSTFLNNAPPFPAHRPTTLGHNIAVDSFGSAYVTGYTDDPAFPVTKGAFQTQCGRCKSGGSFVLKLKPDGSGITYSTYFQFGDEVVNDGPINQSFIGPLWLQVSPERRLRFVFSTHKVGSTKQVVSTSSFSADGSSLQLESIVELPAFLRAVPDRQGNFLVSGRDEQLSIAAVPGTLQSGRWTGAVLRASDSFILFSTRLPSGVFAEPDGMGGSSG